MRKKGFIYRLTHYVAAVTFVSSLIFPPTTVSAQPAGNLPAVGSMLPTSAGFIPTLIKGITIHPDNPLQFDFIVDTGETEVTGDSLREESNKLIKYFLASMTVPEEELWVNLSPYEEDRIIPEQFGFTEMGRDLLSQDYLLKQLTASLLYPENKTGSEFWTRVYQKAYEMYGTTDLPLNTFNKIWIVPEKAVVYERDNSAFVVQSHLKVMLEGDYITLLNNLGNAKIGADRLPQDAVEAINEVSADVIRKVVIPEIEKEVNEGKTFANLRQIYNALILATWYKNNLKDSLLGQVYADKNKIKGIDADDKQAKEKIYRQYVQAFEKGVYNYIRDDVNTAKQDIVPRKYFSGGFTALTAEGDDLATAERKQGLKEGAGISPDKRYIIDQGLEPNSKKTSHFFLNTVRLYEQGRNPQDAAKAQNLLDLQTRRAVSVVIPETKEALVGADGALLARAHTDTEEIKPVKQLAGELYTEINTRLSELKTLIKSFEEGQSDVLPKIAQQSQALTEGLSKKRDMFSHNSLNRALLETILHGNLLTSDGKYVGNAWDLGNLMYSLSLQAQVIKSVDPMKDLTDRQIPVVLDFLNYISAASHTIWTIPAKESNEKFLIIDPTRRVATPSLAAFAGSLYETMKPKVDRIGLALNEFQKDRGNLDYLKDVRDEIEALKAAIPQQEAQAPDDLSRALLQTIARKEISGSPAAATGKEWHVLSQLAALTEKINTIEKAKTASEADVKDMQTITQSIKNNTFDFLLAIKNEPAQEVRIFDTGADGKVALNPLPGPEQLDSFRKLAKGLAQNIKGTQKAIQPIIRDYRAGKISLDEAMKKIAPHAKGFSDNLAALDKDAKGLNKQLIATIRSGSLETAEGEPIGSTGKEWDIATGVSGFYTLETMQVEPQQLKQNFVKAVKLFGERSRNAGQFLTRKQKENGMPRRVWTKTGPIIDPRPDAALLTDNGRMNTLRRSVTELYNDLLAVLQALGEENVAQWVPGKIDEKAQAHLLPLVRKLQETLQKIGASGDQLMQMFSRTINWMSLPVADHTVLNIEWDLEKKVNDIFTWLKEGEMTADNITAVLNAFDEVQSIADNFVKPLQTAKQIYVTRVETLAGGTIDVINPRYVGVPGPAKQLTSAELPMTPVVPAKPAQVAKSPELLKQEEEQPVGGIDLNPQLLDLQIKRDGKGVPLPVSQQSIEKMQIEGFLPVIINVTPIPSLPSLLGISSEKGEPSPELSALK